MAIRKNTNPRMMDLQPEMQDILRRNGMQAHVVSDGTGYRLVVQGHDSPLLTYDLTERQMLALTDWGTNSANKKAYNVFTSIVGKDFYMPKNFVHTRNANGRVAMGLHGYRIGMGEYGRVGRLGMPPPFLGWTPRHQWGFHLRRVGGQLFYPGPPIVPERWDGRMKPGELQSGGYGFYYKYKAGQPVQPAQQADVLQNLQTVITPLVSRPRSTEPARTYKELIASPVYFSNEKWQECLASHGLIVDKEARTLTVQSEKVTADLVYDLTEEETAVLTSNSIEEQPVEKRLEVLNGVIGADFADKVTMADLDSKQRIALGLHPEVQEELTQRQPPKHRLPVFPDLLVYFSFHIASFARKKQPARAATWFHCLFVAILVADFLNHIHDCFFRINFCAFCHSAHLCLQHLHCRNCKILLCIDFLSRLHNLLLLLIQSCMPQKSQLKRYIKVFFIIHFANFRKFLVNLCQKFCFFLFISARYAALPAAIK